MADRRRGRLKVFLGYASNVGKSFRMLDEGRRRRERGQDVVIGALQPHSPPDVQELLLAYEIVPTLQSHGKSMIDIPAVIRRAPQICLVDGLAYDNAPSSRNMHRWQDVEELLQAGISVIGTVNLERIDDQREAVQSITGRAVKQLIPRMFLQQADEIVLVDRASKAASATDEQLREMALLLSADVIDARLQAHSPFPKGEPLRSAQERLLIYLTPNADVRRMLASAQQTAARFHCGLSAVYVPEEWKAGQERAQLQDLLASFSKAGISVQKLSGPDPVEAVARHARAASITQIFASHNTNSSWRRRLRPCAARRLSLAARGTDVRVFSC